MVRFPLGHSVQLLRPCRCDISPHGRHTVPHGARGQLDEPGWLYINRKVYIYPLPFIILTMFRAPDSQHSRSFVYRSVGYYQSKSSIVQSLIRSSTVPQLVV